MSIALVVTAGFGNGTLTGSIADVVTRGYTIGEAVSIVGAIKMVANPSKRSMMANPTNRDMVPNPTKRDMVINRG